MKLTNAMEHSVRSHVARMQQEHGDGKSACWCPLCRADMIALSLSSLPPRYWTKHTTAIDTDIDSVYSVREEVSRAVRQVDRNPKHPRGNALAPAATVWVVNFPLEESFHVVDSLIRMREGACDCWTCRCDMVAFALNRYPAKYGVEHEGRTHLLAEERDKMRQELTSFLNLASNVVTHIPHHGPGA